jgi:hypothetical protein
VLHPGQWCSQQSARIEILLPEYIGHTNTFASISPFASALLSVSAAEGFVTRGFIASVDGNHDFRKTFQYQRKCYQETGCKREFLFFCLSVPLALCGYEEICKHPKIGPSSSPKKRPEPSDTGHAEPASVGEGQRHMTIRRALLGNSSIPGCQ